MELLKMTAGSKNVVLLVRNMARSDCIIHAGGRAYNGIAHGIAQAAVRQKKEIFGYEAGSE